MEERVLLAFFELFIIIAAIIFLLALPFYPHIVEVDEVVTAPPVEVKKPVRKPVMQSGPYNNPSEIKGYFEYIYNVSDDDIENLPNELLEICKFKKDSDLYKPCLAALYKKQNNIEIIRISKASRKDHNFKESVPIGVEVSSGQFYLCYYWQEMVFIKRVKYDCILGK